MKDHLSSRGEVILCTLRVQCHIHGSHRLLVGGHDDTAVFAAEHLKQVCDDDGFPTTLDVVRIPFDMAEEMARDGLGGSDDRTAQ